MLNAVLTLVNLETIYINCFQKFDAILYISINSEINKKKKKKKENPINNDTFRYEQHKHKHTKDIQIN